MAGGGPTGPAVGFLRPELAPSLASARLRWLIALSAVLSLSVLERGVPIAGFGLAALFFLIGTPHGGVLRNESGVSAPSFWFCFLYLCLGLMIAMLWWAIPAASLVLFLCLSAWHFGAAEPDLKSAGLAVVLGVFAAWPEQTLTIFAALIGEETPRLSESQVTNWRAVGLLALAAPVIEALWRKRGLDRALLLVAILLLLSPVLAVATYFLWMHASRDYADTLDRVEGSFQRFWALFAPTGLPALIGGGALIVAFAAGWVDAIVLGAAGAGIALPHLLQPAWWTGTAR